MNARTLLSSLLLLAVAAPAYATTPILTAYLRDLDSVQHLQDDADVMTTDAQGNAYVGVRTTEGVFDEWTIRKYDTYGTLTWSQSVNVYGHSGMTAMKVDPNGGVYVAGYTFWTSNLTAVVRLDPSGATSFVVVDNSLNATSQVPIAITYDKVGNTHVAISAMVGGKHALELLALDASGAVSGIPASLVGIQPVHGSFNADGYYFGNGVASQESAWEVCTPAGTQLELETAATSPAHQRNYVTATDANQFYVAESYDDNGVSQYTVRCFSEAGGGHVWIAGPYPGVARSLCVAGGFVYASVDTGTGSLIQKLNSTGPILHFNAPVSRLTADGTGIVAYTGLAGFLDKTPTFNRYLPTGALDWSIKATFPAGITQALIGSISTSGGSTYVAASTPLGEAHGGDGLLWKFHPGQSISSITSPTPKLQGGFVLSGSVHLVSAASASTAATCISSNPTLIWIPSSVTVLKGATTAGWQAYTAVVDAVTPVNLTAKQGGVARIVTITLNPAPLDNIILTAPSVKGGVSDSATVNLDGITGTAGRTVLLKSSDPSVAKVPTSVKVLPGASSAKFTVTTVAGKSGNVTLTATVGATSVTKALTVTP